MKILHDEPTYQTLAKIRVRDIVADLVDPPVTLAYWYNRHALDAVDTTYIFRFTTDIPKMERSLLHGFKMKPSWHKCKFFQLALSYSELMAVMGCVTDEPVDISESCERVQQESVCAHLHWTAAHRQA